MATLDHEAELSRLQMMRQANIIRPHQVERLAELEQQMGVTDNAPNLSWLLGPHLLTRLLAQSIST